MDITKFDRNVLYQLALELDLPELLVLCKSDKRFRKTTCTNERFWKEFGNYPKSLEQSTGEKTYDLLKGLIDLREKWGNVKYINILNKMRKSIKSLSLEQLYNKISLNLSKNNLTTIPKEIENLHNLRYLILYSNELKSIPKEIGKLTKLIELNLRDNKLKHIPKEIGNLHNLRYLKLSKNELTSIPKEIGDLKELEVLDLNNNKLSSLPKELVFLTKLIEFNTENNPLINIPKEIKQINLIPRESLNPFRDF